MGREVFLNTSAPPLLTELRALRCHLNKGFLDSHRESGFLHHVPFTDTALCLLRTPTARNLRACVQCVPYLLSITDCSRHKGRGFIVLIVAFENLE